jgi:hypothetical protein
MNAISRRPRPGDRVQTVENGAPSSWILLTDGSLVITPEELARFGNGDAKRGRRELKLMVEAEREREVSNGPTARPENVRIAVEKDEDAIYELLLQDLRENAVHVAPIDEDKIRDHITAGTRKRGGIVGVIDGIDGNPVAVVILVPNQWWWSRAYYIQDIVNYVHPDHRTSRHIHDLIQFERWAADEWSSKFGYRIYLLCGVLGYKRVREKMIMYKRKFLQAGAAFLYPAPREGDGI